MRRISRIEREQRKTYEDLQRAIKASGSDDPEWPRGWPEEVCEALRTLRDLKPMHVLSVAEAKAQLAKAKQATEILLKAQIFEGGEQH